MPRKAKVSSVPPETKQPNQPYLIPGDAPWGGFINIKLDEEQQAAFWEWSEEHGAHIAGYFDEIIGEGIKASFSYDAEHQCYICAVTGALVDAAPGSRFCSTSRAASMADVVALTVWKHAVLAEGDYGNYQPRTSKFLSFG